MQIDWDMKNSKKDLEPVKIYLETLDLALKMRKIFKNIEIFQSILINVYVCFKEKLHCKNMKCNHMNT